MLWRRRRPWRHHLDDRREGCARRRRRILLTAAFVLEAFCFCITGKLNETRLHMEFIRREQEYRMEVIAQDAAEAAKAGDIYGVRFCPGTLELQFYHSWQTVLGSGLNVP